MSNLLRQRLSQKNSDSFTTSVPTNDFDNSFSNADDFDESSHESDELSFGDEDDAFDDSEDFFDSDESEGSFATPSSGHSSLRQKFAQSDSASSDDWFSVSSEQTSVDVKKNWFETMMDSSNTTDSQSQPESDYDLQDAFGLTEEELEIVELQKQWANEKKVKRYVFFTRLVNLLLITGCIYMIFLIFGVSVTDFQYSSNGKVEPQVLGIKDIKSKKDFNVIKVEYEKCQMLYEKLLILNYRLENAEEGPQKVATEYQPLGDEFRTLFKKEQGVVVKSEYTPLLKLMQTFLDSCQQYCDKVAIGYTANNESAIEAAGVLWNGNGINNQTGEAVISIQDQFIVIHQNIVALGEGLKGVDMLTIKQWRPDVYVDEYINGKEK